MSVKRELPLLRNRVSSKRYLEEQYILPKPNKEKKEYILPKPKKGKKEPHLLPLSPSYTSNEDNENDIPMLESVPPPFAVKKWLGSFPIVFKDPVFFQESPETVENVPLVVSPVLSVSPKKGLKVAIVAADASLKKHPSFGAIDSIDN